MLPVFSIYLFNFFIQRIYRLISFLFYFKFINTKVFNLCILEIILYKVFIFVIFNEKLI